MLQFQLRMLLVAADQFDGTNQLLRSGIFEKKREALDGFVGQPAAAWFFPCQVFVKDVDLVTRLSELLATHGTGGPATYDRYLSHGLASAVPRGCSGCATPKRPTPLEVELKLRLR